MFAHRTGMNPDELSKNPVLTDWDVKVIQWLLCKRCPESLCPPACIRRTVQATCYISLQDLNVDPKLPYEDNTYDVRIVGVHLLLLD
jgi:hypothetical protein